MPEAPFDLGRLAPDELALWHEYGGGDAPVFAAWSFGYMCMLELGRVPAVVADYLAEHDPEGKITQYLQNVRAARRGMQP
jgi:hypothetical protein